MMRTNPTYKRFSVICLLAAVFLPSSSYAVLSTTTVNIIIGSAPYFTFDNGATKATSTDTLLGIKLSNGAYYSRNSNPSNEFNPIELPEYGQTIANISMLVPIDAANNSIYLNDLIGHPHYYGRDDNGDAGLNATGVLSVTVEDVDGYRINDRRSGLDSCKGPYKVTLNSTASVISTQTGYPNSTYYDALSATYYIKPKTNGVPTSCYAQPSLTFNNSDRGRYTGNGYGNWDGPGSQWDHNKGFFLQDINNPNSNFPTMGAHGLFFNLFFFNAHANNITYEKNPGNSGLGLNINTVNSSRITVTLIGPTTGANVNSANTAVPTTFTIKARGVPIYTFRINNWFIVKAGAGNGYSENYCSKTYGSNYRTPNIKEYTNANGSGWRNGLAGQPNNYQRRIGGGLFAEWGNMVNYSSFTNSSLDADFWAAQTSSGLQQMNVGSDSGDISYDYRSKRSNRMACIK